MPYRSHNSIFKQYILLDLIVNSVKKTSQYITYYVTYIIIAICKFCFSLLSVFISFPKSQRGKTDYARFFFQREKNTREKVNALSQSTQMALYERWHPFLIHIENQYCSFCYTKALNFFPLHLSISKICTRNLCNGKYLLKEMLSNSVL